MIRLIPITRKLLDDWASPKSVKDLFQIDDSRDFLKTRDIVVRSVEFQNRVGAQFPWTCYLVISEELASVVGCCGFKGNPNQAAEVEIMYYTYPECEGRGFASSMAQRLVEIACKVKQIQLFVALTAAEFNASTRILRKLGFLYAGEEIGADNQPLWKWCLEPALITPGQDHFDLS